MGNFSLCSRLYVLKLITSFASSLSRWDPDAAYVTEAQTVVMSRSVGYKHMKVAGRARLQLHLVERRFRVPTGNVQGESSDSRTWTSKGNLPLMIHGWCGCCESAPVGPRSCSKSLLLTKQLCNMWFSVEADKSACGLYTNNGLKFKRESEMREYY